MDTEKMTVSDKWDLLLVWFILILINVTAFGWYLVLKPVECLVSR